MKYFYTLIFISFSILLNAQIFDYLEYPLTENGETKPNAFTGGMNVPQFSDVDLNDDGLMDLYVFDREGNISMTFLQVMEGGNPRYQFAPDYLENFPRIINWVLLRDFDGDSVMDIFASASDEGLPGVKVFKGFIDNGKINFTRFQFYTNFGFDIITWPLTNGQHTNAEVSNIDYPSIDDIDNDGDLDLMTFDGGGSWMWWYKNMSQESGFGADSLHFILEDDCWGGFKESGLDSSIELAPAPGECAEGLPENPNEIALQTRHSGSTVLSFDENNDGLHEMFIGDLLSIRITGMHNAGTIDDAWIDTKDDFYPSNSAAVGINFPASYYVDVNFDGKKDFLAAPNENNNSPNLNCAWFYENMTNNENPVFELSQQDFLVETMLDLGSNTFPTFADVTGDGLLDMVIGNSTYYQPDGSKEAYLRLYENTGSADAPAFSLMDENWLNFNQYTANNATWRFAPTFGDIDSDGDLDLFVGDRNGNLFYAENSGGEGNPMEFNAIIPLWKGIDVGQNATPNVVDLNRDGLPDLVIGQRNKFIRYFQNIGTETEPEFNSDFDVAPNTGFLGQIDLSIPGFPTGFGAPVIIDFGGEYKLFSGNEEGKIHLYENIENNVDGAFLQVSNFYAEIDAGNETAPTFADLNNDGLLEMAVGNARGGLNIFGTDLELNPDNTTSIDKEINFNLMPNPVDNQLVIELGNIENGEIICTIYNTIGQKMNEEIVNNKRSEIEVGDLPSGVYFVEIRVREKIGVQRFVKD